MRMVVLNVARTSDAGRRPEWVWLPGDGLVVHPGWVTVTLGGSVLPACIRHLCTLTDTRELCNEHGPLSRVVLCPRLCTDCSPER